MTCHREAGTRKKGRAAKRRANMMSIINLLNDTPSPDTNHRHPPRDKYDDEEAIFIWYNRIDLGLPWNRVQEKFQLQFDKPRGKGGLQCKHYRVLTTHNIPKVRDQGPRGSRRPQDRANWGVIARTSIRYPWMLPYHQVLPQQFKSKL